MIAMVIKVTIHFLVTFLTKITNLPMFTFAVILNTLRTGDADLRFYITTVQDG